MAEEAVTHAAADDDDATLTTRAGAGEQAAFELLMRRHNRRLYRLARAVLRDTAEAEDALQEAYLAAYRSMNTFRGDSSLSTWLCRFVLNECLGRRRRSARRQSIIPIVSATGDACIDTAGTADGEAPEAVVNRAQVRAILESKLDALPESMRTVFVLRSIEDLSVKETAACLDVPEATVRSRHFRARSLLREAIAREIDVAEPELFDFGGTQCDRVIAGVLRRLGK